MQLTPEYEQSVKANIIRYRRELHSHPELAFQEFYTSTFINAILVEAGFKEVYNGLASTGVVAVLRGEIDESILIRADMDALPIKEDTGLQFKSQKDGVMHACGHDAHVAMLLGTAVALIKLVQEGLVLKRGVKFCFQPGEENGFNGAKKLIEDPLYDTLNSSPRVQYCFGLHITSMLGCHKLGYEVGPVTAMTDKWEINIVGQGGHANSPETSVDALQIGIQIVNALYQVRGKNTSQLHPSTLTIGRFSSGDYHNIINDKAQIHGQVRTFREIDRESIFSRIKKICSGAEIQHDCTVVFKQMVGYKQVINAPQLKTFVTESLEKVNVVLPMNLGLAGEDFYNFAEQRPSAYFILGAKPINVANQNTLHNHHSSKFDFNEDALITGVKAWLSIINQWQIQ